MSNKTIHWIIAIGGIAVVAEAAMTAGGQAAGPIGIVIAALSIWGALRNQ